MQTRKEFIGKTFKALFAKWAFGTKMGVTLWHHLAESFTADREETTVSMIRGFKPDENFL